MLASREVKSASHGTLVGVCVLSLEMRRCDRGVILAIQDVVLEHCPLELLISTLKP